MLHRPVLWIAVAALSACVPKTGTINPRLTQADAEVVAVRDLPVEPIAWGYSAEEQAFHEISQLYGELFGRGWGPVELHLDDRVVLAYSADDAVVMRRFLVDAPSARRHLEALSELYFGGRLALDDIPPDDLVAMYRVYGVATLAHELAHNVSRHVHAADRDDPVIEEARARTLEVAVLRHLVATGRLDADALERYRAFNQLQLDALPADATSGLPEEEALRHAALGQGYDALARGETAGTDAVVWTLLHHRVALLTQDGAPDVRDLGGLLATPADARTDAMREALLSQRAVVTAAEPGVLDANIDRDGKAWTLRVEDIEDGPILVTSTLPIAAQAKRRGAVLELVNHIATSDRREHRYDAVTRFELADDGSVRLVSAWPLLATQMSPAQARVLVTHHLESAETWWTAFEAVAAGTDPAKAFQAAQEAP